MQVFYVFDKQVELSEKEENTPISTKKLEGQIELKPLPSNLRYAFLGAFRTYPVIISSELLDDREVRLINILRKHRKNFDWTLVDLQGISPLICTHKIHLEDGIKISKQFQRCLNGNMQEVVRNKVLKFYMQKSFIQYDANPDRLS